MARRYANNNLESCPSPAMDSTAWPLRSPWREQRRTRRRFRRCSGSCSPYKSGALWDFRNQLDIRTQGAVSTSVQEYRQAHRQPPTRFTAASCELASFKFMKCMGTESTMLPHSPWTGPLFLPSSDAGQGGSAGLNSAWTLRTHKSTPWRTTLPKTPLGLREGHAVTAARAAVGDRIFTARPRAGSQPPREIAPRVTWP